MFFIAWQHGGENDKTKYLFTLPDEEALYMAAIYKPFATMTGGMLPHFSILTAAASDSICDVHNRMPVVLRRSEFDEWLYGDYMGLFERSSVCLRKVAT